MPVLLCSLGTSWAVVPEAFHALPPGEGGFSAVHVLTTASPKIDAGIAEIRNWFASRHPQVRLTVSRVAQFEDLRSEADHFAFEEVLYRWMLEVAASVPLAGPLKARGTPASTTGDGGLLPHVCLAGGFKTISAAMQKAAAVLGAAEVFHVLADQSISTAKAIDAAIAAGTVSYIRLGAESGWPQLRASTAVDYPLETVTSEDGVRRVRAPDMRFRLRLREIVERSHRIAENWSGLADLPFAELATWPAADLAWLGGSLDPGSADDRAWIAALPKVELHCHLGGFATHGADLAAIRAAASDPAALPPLLDRTPPEGWPVPRTPCGLEPYRKLGDNNGSALLRDRDCLRAQCEALYAHFVAERVLYAEVRCSPANYATPGRSPLQVLMEIREAFQNCMAAVAASVPLADSPRARGTPAPTSDPRIFHPFDPEAGHRQTWRDLPHRDQPGATAFVTFRLADSLPADRMRAWYAEREAFLRTHPEPWSVATSEAFRRQFPERLEAWLDEACGACVLREPETARLAESALRHFDGERYILDAFVIMPNHVHVLLKPLPGFTLEGILHSWKSYTAKTINEHLGRSGRLWEHESFDHLVRSEAHLARFRRYIEENPARAGLRDGFVVGRGAGLRTVAANLPLAVPQRARGTPAPTPHVNLLVIATRQERGDFRSAISRHLTLAVTAAEHWTDPDTCRVVGVDLAGFEDPSTRAHLYREDFKPAHRCNLALTVHAGENDDAEGVWSAVLDLNARRLGHALSLGESPDLLRTVVDRGIAVEMCPYANLQIKGYAVAASVPLAGSEAPVAASVPLAGSEKAGGTPASTRYPLLDYLRAGVRVTVNTDNIGISAASLADNLLLAARLCPGLTRLDVLRLQRHALDAAFIPPAVRGRLLEAFATALARARA